MYKPFHNVQGLTTPEYRQLRDELRQPRLYWPPLLRSDLRRALASALYHANLFLKAEQAVKALTAPGAYASPRARSMACTLLATLETRDLYLLRDQPARSPSVWTANKARLACKLDLCLRRIAEEEFPDDRDMAARCAANKARWLKKRLPGVNKRLKPGPKTGKRKRLHKRKEQTNAEHD